jgi:hypothetical protein
MVVKSPILTGALPRAAVSGDDSAAVELVLENISQSRANPMSVLLQSQQAGPDTSMVGLIATVILGSVAGHTGRPSRASLVGNWPGIRNAEDLSRILTFASLNYSSCQANYVLCKR